jgi:hypothetical protein
VTQVPVDVCDSTDCTPLHCAAALGDAALVTALLKAGAQPGAHDAEGLMPLHLAVRGTNHPAWEEHSMSDPHAHRLTADIQLHVPHSCLIGRP